MQAIFGIEDLEKMQIGHTIKKLQESGIRVRMVTGDSKEASKHMAKKVGII
jgi:P-type E1-E2 ATPase